MWRQATVLTRLKVVEFSLLRLVSPPVLLAIIFVLHLELKFSHILPIGLLFCTMYHNHSGKMLHFHNHCHLFLENLIFFVFNLGIPIENLKQSASINSYVKLSWHFDLETTPGLGVILSWGACSNFSHSYLKVWSYW